MIRRMPRTMLAAALALGLSGCSDSSATAPDVVTPTAPTPVAGDLVAILNADIQDEYRAEAIYQGVLLDLGAQTRPFVNIVEAERQHARSVAALFTARGLAVPQSLWSTSNVPRFATLREACAAGAGAERENIALYDSQLGADLPGDVRRVLESNRAASLDNHLPAFQRCQ